MKGAGLFAAVCLVALTAVRAEESDVVTITKDNFADTIANELVLVKFYAPWCGHCKSMAADFKKAATTLKGKAVLADLDATEEKELAAEWGIKGFPTLKIFSNGEFVQDYKSGRDEDAIVKFMEKANEPAYETFTSEADTKKFLEANAEKIVVVGGALDEATAKFFRKDILQLPESVGDAVAFAAVSDVAFVKSSGSIEANGFLMIKSKEEESAVLVYDASTDESVSDWVKGEATPAFGYISPTNAQMYVDAGVPLFCVFSDTKKLDEETNKIFTTVAKNLKSDAKGKLSFVWTDETLASFRDHLGLKDKNPAAAIYLFTGDTKFLFPGEKFTVEAVSAFAKEYLDGKLKPVLKSEAVPETNDEPVKVVVGDSWKDVVEDEEKDVLIEQYAPWCGHCKKLTPIYDDLAASLADVDSIVIAKMDATLNDAPPEHKASGFPTIKFFPAGGKAPMAYNGGREKKSFIEFLSKHATKKFKAPEVTEEEGADKEEEEEEEYEEEDYDEEEDYEEEEEL